MEHGTKSGLMEGNSDHHIPSFQCSFIYIYTCIYIYKYISATISRYTQTLKGPITKLLAQLQSQANTFNGYGLTPK